MARTNTRTRRRAGEERKRQHARDQAEYNAAQKQENTNSLTDSGNARRLIEQHGADIRYVAQMKTWYIWNGRYWEQDRTGEIMRRAQQTVRSLYLEAYNTEDRVARRALVDWARQSESNSRLKAMVEIAQFQSEVVATPDQFDGQDWLLNCRNCTVDLRRGVALKHNREHMLTSALPFDYDPKAQCPTFLAFLDTIMGGNQRLINFLQRAIGYTLTGDVREECVFIPWGDGSNGKSTLLNVICALLGAFSRSISPDTLTATKRQRDGAAASPDIARLRGARFAYAIEAEEGHALSESRVKQLSSRENIAARGVYEEMAEFPPTWKVWYATNHKPVVHGTDDAIWRRIRLIPFSVRLYEPGEHPEAPEHLRKDKNLGAKLRAEYSGILNWAVAGCLAWQQDGLQTPPEVYAATQDYRRESDVVGAFIDHYCVTAPNYRVSRDVLYNLYSAWCEWAHEARLGERKFAEKLRARGFHQERTARNGKNEWWGIGLRADYADSATPSADEGIPSVNALVPSVNALLPSVNEGIPSVNEGLPSVPSVPSVVTNPEFKGTSITYSVTY